MSTSNGKNNFSAFKPYTFRDYVIIACSDDAMFWSSSDVFSSYINSMKKVSTLADAPIIQATANLLGTEIHIHCVMEVDKIGGLEVFVDVIVPKDYRIMNSGENVPCIKLGKYFRYHFVGTEEDV
jgi:hypothetical protein